jgi:hypothetical protein
MKEVKSLQKDGKVAFGNTKYNFLSEAKTTEIFKEQFVKHGLVFLPVAAQQRVQANDKGNYLTTGEFTYRLINAENPEEFIELESIGQGYDSADKGGGKASSTAYKYLMWRTFAIPSNDDPDNISSDELTGDPVKEKDEWEAAEKVLFDTGKKLGLLPNQVQDTLSKKHGGALYFTLTVDDLKQGIKDMEKKIKEQEK